MGLVANIKGPQGPQGPQGPTGPSGPVNVLVAGTLVSTRQNLNFVSGATVSDDPTTNAADITITGGGSGNLDGGTPESVYIVSQNIDGGGP